MDCAGRAKRRRRFASIRKPLRGQQKRCRRFALPPQSKSVAAVVGGADYYLINVDADQPTKAEAARYRLFIALPVPQAVKHEINLVQERLRRELPERCASWTRPEQWHLTLKFLGNVDAARVGALTDAVRAACERFAPLRLRAERVGCFPGLRKPRVVWVGIHDEGNQLAGLASAVEDAASGFTTEEREGRFTGHITIARIKNFDRRVAERVAKAVESMGQLAFGAWTAEAVELMRSELASDGARHTCLARLPLNKIS
jgi:2'-5' RNA ligase